MPKVVALLTAVLACSAVASPLVELASDSFSLMAPEASVSFRPSQIKVANRFVFRAAFQTRVYSGNLLRLQVDDGDDRRREISVAIDRRSIRLRSEKIADTDTDNERLLAYFDEIDVADGLWHNLSITVHVFEGDILMELDGVPRSNGLRESFQLENTPDHLFNFRVDIGGFIETDGVDSPQGEFRPGFVGCAGRLSIYNGTEAYLPVEQSRTAFVENGCVNACSWAGCDSSVCLNNYTESICDCAVTTEATGCKYDSKKGYFDGDQFVSVPLTGEGRQPRRLLVSFKPETDDRTTVLIHAYSKAKDGDRLTLLYDSFSLKILRSSNVALMDVSTPKSLQKLRWHTVGIYITKRKLYLQVDLDVIGEKALAKDLLFDEVSFGGTDDPEVEQPGFMGCLKRIYVDYTSIGDLIDDGGTAIRIGKSFYDASCPVADALADPESDTDKAKDIDLFDATAQATSAPSTVESSANEDAKDVNSRSKDPSSFVVEHADKQKDESLSNSQSGPVRCTGLDCQHGTKCVKAHQNEPEQCDCTDSGYSGDRCQFSILPSTCDELYRRGETRNGVFLIDPDASGPGEPVYVKCERDETTNTSVTIVDNNFPNEYYIRKNGVKDSVYKIVYRNMTTNVLRSLLSKSQSCKQHIKYSCNGSPIELNKKTWFRSAFREEKFAQIGVQSDKCPCAIDGKCKTFQRNCNCDKNEQVTDQDEGNNIDEFSAITEMTVLQHKDSYGWATMSIGPLKCHGSRGIDDIVQFRTSEAVLQFARWSGHKLSFWLKTSVEDGRLFSQRSTNGRYFNVQLQNAHTFAVGMDLQSDRSSPKHTELELVSQKPINDDNWHRFSIEVVDGQIRFAIDSQENFYRLIEGQTLDDKTFDGEFVFGGDFAHGVLGFVGCVRQLIMDDKLLEFKFDSADQHLRKGCQNHCLVAECQNNAKCVEDYQTEHYKCQCLKKYSHFGPHCQIDIDKDTEISFRDSTDAYVTVRDFKTSPIANNRIVFSFRTDQTSALMLFAHDHNYNMFQIHLLEGNRISLTVNYLDELVQCTIKKSDGDYNNMNWFQVVVLFSNNETSLLVDEELCKIKGRRLLSEIYLDAWEGDIGKLRAVYPPRPPVPPSQMPEYTLLYIGGVRRAYMRDGRSALFKRDSGQVIYSSPLPNMLGCVRGFMIGSDHLDLRSANKSSDHVVPSCSVGCRSEQAPCYHDGYCKVNWKTGFSSCDCVPTSYLGSQCQLDTGAKFEGNQIIVVPLELILQRIRLPTLRSYDGYSFAFSSTAVNHNSNQILADLTINAEKNIRIYILPNGQLTIDIIVPSYDFFGDPDTTRLEHTFLGNFLDGGRHFVFLKFFGSKLIVKVDRQYWETPKVDWTLGDIRSISIAGLESAKNSGYANYTGCMSNVLIELRSDQPFIRKPLDIVLRTTPLDGTEIYEKVYPSDPSIQPLLCAQYTAQKPMPPPPVLDHLPNFTEKLVVEDYVPESDDKPGTLPPQKEESKNYGVIIGLVALAIVILVCIAVCIYYTKCVKKKRGEPVPLEPSSGTHTTSPDEKQPFIGSGGGMFAPITGLPMLPVATTNLDDESTYPMASGSPPPIYRPTNTPPPSDTTTDDDAPPVGPEDMIAMMTPTVKRTPSTKRGAFVLGLPDVVGYSNEVQPPSPASPVATLTHRPSIPRRQPVAVPVPKV